jgi:hypothetical protein
MGVHARKISKERVEMRIKFLAIGAAMLLTLGLSLTVNAGAILDSDIGGGDDIPDVFDNCQHDKNGPGEAPSNQVDTDSDGHGNACDCDYDQNQDQNGIDITAMFAESVFLQASPLHDMDASGEVNGIDVNACLNRFLCPPGQVRIAPFGVVTCTVPII